MSASFTKGPWLASYDAHSGDFMIHFDNDEGRGPSLLEGGLVLANNAENAANANLIAAAPDLYEALVFAEGQLDELINRHYGGEIPCTDEEAAGFEKIETALAKARGLTMEQVKQESDR